MNKTRLRLGEWYAVRVVAKAHRCANGYTMPRSEARKPMQLIDLRSNGIAIMAEDVVGFGFNPDEGTALDAMAGRIRRFPTRRTALHRVRLSDVLATWGDWQAKPKEKTRTGGLVLAW